jgi:hypothetical protein
MMDCLIRHEVLLELCLSSRRKRGITWVTIFKGIIRSKICCEFMVWTEVWMHCLHSYLLLFIHIWLGKTLLSLNTNLIDTISSSTFFYLQ